ncbi:hypothetical protein NSTC745_05310 [Nostoc sp. DSM 114161]
MKLSNFESENNEQILSLLLPLSPQPTQVLIDLSEILT